ncbi:MAG: thioredoxin domain-containing protein [Deltaproteobacteria bacterium]|nr:thioredoxin domain-containing protein [Deltaproteobacteria bacterium]
MNSTFKSEKSPYLLQHVNNPVDWYPWGEPAFEKARREDKPIFLSSGYSTCHWCHVMAHESFEDGEVANILNQSFVSIKLDREEHPEIDKIYMDALQAMQGQGGWPMSVFLNHDLKPFYAGTYFPKRVFKDILFRIADGWKQEREKINHHAQEITAYLTNAPISEREMLDERMFNFALRHARQNYDSAYGGFGGAPKFPPSMKLQLLMRIANRSPEGELKNEILKMVRQTLDQMACGGMYDHLGGGFHRYATDERWRIPHFEKMLYDNALLACTYLEAYAFTHESMYQEVAQEILNYVLREMTAPEGGFYTAQDADSEGGEGAFYVWTYAELESLLTQAELKKVTDVYAVSIQGNFEEGTNVFYLSSLQAWKGKKDPLLIEAHAKLLRARQTKEPPLKDDKILTDWNGLMMGAMAKGYQVLKNPLYLKAAQKAAHFVEQHLFKNQVLLKRFREGEARFEAALDDYAYFIWGLMELYEADFDSHWLDWARELQNIQDRLFWDETDGGYFYTSSNVRHLIRRTKEYHDEARPNSNAVAALNLMKLQGWFLDPASVSKARSILENASGSMAHDNGAYSQMLVALDFYLSPRSEIVIVSKDQDVKAKEMVENIYQVFFPYRQLSWITEENAAKLPLTKDKVMKDHKTTVYVCEAQRCQEPVHTWNEVERKLKSKPLQFES